MRGTVVAIWRYPVKSMLGESLASVRVTDGGLEGDRTLAVVDPETGRVLSAKREAALFTCRARMTNEGRTEVVMPGGKSYDSNDPGLQDALSEMLGRRVVVTGDRSSIPHIEIGENSAMTGGVASEFTGPSGTFFDSAPIHVVTNSSLVALKEMLPGAVIDERRFRPNFLVSIEGEPGGFIEESWVGKEMSIGESLGVEILQPCGRCVMVTHSQDELPRDKAILQTVARRNDNNLGVLGRVTRSGYGSVGDEVRIA